MHSLICDFCSSDQRFARGLVGSPHPASLRFHLTMNTLAFGYILPTTGWIPDFHRLETCAAGRTTMKSGSPQIAGHRLNFTTLKKQTSTDYLPWINSSRTPLQSRTNITASPSIRTSCAISTPFSTKPAFSASMSSVANAICFVPTV